MLIRGLIANAIRPQFMFKEDDGAGDGKTPEELAAEAAAAEGSEGAEGGAAPAGGTLTQAQFDEALTKRLARQAKADRAKWEADLAAMAEAENDDAATRERKRAEAAETETAAERKARIGDKVEMRAERLGLQLGVNPKRMPKLLKLLALDKADLDELAPEGKLDDDAIKSLIEAELADMPELKAAGAAAPEGSSSGEFVEGGSAPKVWTREAIAKLSVAEYDKHADEIDEQMRKGLIK